MLFTVSAGAAYHLQCRYALPPLHHHDPSARGKKKKKKTRNNNRCFSLNAICVLRHNFTPQIEQKLPSLLRWHRHHWSHATMFCATVWFLELHVIILRAPFKNNIQSDHTIHRPLGSTFLSLCDSRFKMQLILSHPCLPHINYTHHLIHNYETNKQIII